MKVASGNICLSEPSSIYECPTCGFLFRRPYPAADELVKTYRELPADIWDNSAGRVDFRLAAETIQGSCESGCILDVGCFRGDFLAMLPESYEKFGVEPARAAREIAERRGIRLIGDSLQAIQPGSRAFHAITMMDVIEHLPYPMAAMEQLLGLLLPGGLLIVSTGNSSALPWRLMRRDYWYYFGDHVSFFNPGWFRWMAARLNYEVVRVNRFSHSRRACAPGALCERYRELARCLAYWVSCHACRYRALRSTLCRIYPVSKALSWQRAPGTSCWPDHMLVVLRRGY